MDIRKVSEPNVRLRAKWSLIHIVNNESQWHRHASARVISDACAVRDFTFRRKSLKQATAWGSSFSSVFSAMAEPADTETSGNPPGGCCCTATRDTGRPDRASPVNSSPGREPAAPGNGYVSLLYFPYPLPPSGCEQCGTCSYYRRLRA